MTSAAEQHSLSPGRLTPGPSATHTVATNMPATDTPSVPPTSALRLNLRPPSLRERSLDGGWWPQSWDPGTELPGLVRAVDASRGPVTRVALSAEPWDDSPRSVRVGERVVCLIWSRTIDPHQVVLTGANGDRTSLLVVPPQTSMSRAAAALAAAAAPEGATAQPEDVLRQVSILPPEPRPC